MKRFNNLYENIISIDNILLADEIARRGKSKQTGIIKFDLDFEQNIANIYRELATNTYITSPYKTRIIYERKERVISILPYKDRIVHHAVMNILEPIFVSTFTSDSYSCIKGKGVHKASEALQNALKDEGNTKYYLQIDIKKFYPSVDHDILKQLLRKKLKDKELLSLLDGIIDSAPGLPIGNYLSQYLANFYLTYFDHWLKEQKQVKYYFRYADDIVILASSKEYLHRVLAGVTKYLKNKLNLEVKENYKISPVTNEIGVNFVGYNHFRDYVWVRKATKQNFARKIKKGISNPSKQSHLGWLKHCNAKHLIKKLLPNG